MPPHSINKRKAFGQVVFILGFLSILAGSASAQHLSTQEQPGARFQGICIDLIQEAYPGIDLVGFLQLNQVAGSQLARDRQTFWATIERLIAERNSKSPSDSPKLDIIIVEPDRKMIGQVGRSLAAVVVCNLDNRRHCRNRNLWIDRRVGVDAAAEALLHVGLIAHPIIPVCKYRGEK